MNTIKIIVLNLVLVTSSYAYDIYDGSSNTLNIPIVSVGNTLYKNVQVTVGNVKSVGGVFQPNTLSVQDILKLTYSTPQQMSSGFTGIQNANPISGNATFSIGPLTSTVFEGQSALTTSRSLKEYDLLGNQLSNSTAQVYFDSWIQV